MNRSLVTSARAFHTSSVRYGGRRNPKEIRGKPYVPRPPPLFTGVPIPKRPRQRPKDVFAHSQEALDRLRKSLLSKGPAGKGGPGGFMSNARIGRMYRALVYGGSKAEQQISISENGADQKDEASVLEAEEMPEDTEKTPSAASGDAPRNIMLAAAERYMTEDERSLYMMMKEEKSAAALQYLQTMKQEGIEPSACCYYLTALTCFQKERRNAPPNWTTTEWTVKELMSSPGLDKSDHYLVSCKSMLAFLYARSGDFLKGLDLFGLDMKLADYDINKSIASLRLGRNSRAWRTVMFLLCRSGHHRHVVTVFDHMVLAGCAPTDGAYYSLMEAYGTSANKQGIISVIEDMLRNGIRPSERTIGKALKFLAYGPTPESVVECMSKFINLVESPSLTFANVAIKASARSGAVVPSRLMFRRIHELKEDHVKHYLYMLAAIENSLRAAIRKKWISPHPTTNEQLTSYLSDVIRKDEPLRTLMERSSKLADEFWKEYEVRYGNWEIEEGAEDVRSQVFHAYIRIKSLALRFEEVLGIMEDGISSDKDWKKIEQCEPFTCLLLMAEREGHSGSWVLPRITSLLKSAGVEVDLKFVAYGIGALVKEGKHHHALDLLRHYRSHLLARREVEDAIASAVLRKRLVLLSETCKMFAASSATLIYVKQCIEAFSPKYAGRDAGTEWLRQMKV